MNTQNDNSIDAIGSPDLRKGVYSNIATLTNQQFEDVIDFYFIDGKNPNGTMIGTLVSRIIMSRGALIGLRDAIDQLIAEGSDKQND